MVVQALGTIARARGMSQIARDTGLGRESLYKALSPEGNPEFATVLKVVRALGLKASCRTGRCLRSCWLSASNPCSNSKLRSGSCEHIGA